MDSFRSRREDGIDRRSFVSLLGAGTGPLALPGAAGTSSADTGAGTSANDGLEALSFYSTAAQVSADGGPLTDGDHVVAWASTDASVVIADDGTDEGDVVRYEDERIPLIARDGNVLGIGSAGFLSDEHGGFDVGNEQFMLNVWDELLGPDSTVLWDESHEQYWDLASHGIFRRYAEGNGYELRALEEFETGGASLECYSTASQLSPDGGALTEAAVDAADGLEVLAWAPESATNGDRTGDDGYHYADDERIPLITRDDRVVGFGAPLVTDESDHDENRTFVRNVWDAVIDGETVYWDESHDQYYDTGRFETFIHEVETAGYTVEATTDLLAVLEGERDADAVVITSPATSLTDAELAALESFVDDGGAVLLHDQSDYGDHDETAALNEIADALGLGFRFNADQVEDDATGWDEHVFTTTAIDETYLGGGASSLADADGLVITTPRWEFEEPELAALESFVEDGGAVFLFDQSDFGGNDRTAVMNDIAERLDLAFRFNGGQVEDETHNAGPAYVPLATAFSGPEAYFAARDGVGIEFERDGEYYGRVVRVFDGDTVEIEFDTEYGYRESVRNVGVDTAETPPSDNDPEEWFGIPDDADDHLESWGKKASEFALERLAPDGAGIDEPDIEGRRVTVTFDDSEPVRGNYGRLLGYVHYDPDDFEADPGDGSFSETYNRELIAEGYARVYSSGFGTHDELAALEEEALAAGRGVWSAADLDALPEKRNDPVDTLFVPSARSVHSTRSDDGHLPDDRVPVAASPSAEQRLAAGVAYDGDIPLVGVDEQRRVALVGGLLIDEAYEADEGFGVDTSGYGNFPFLTNLIDYLSETDGDVIVAGGQGQFGAEGSLSLEDCRYYLRYLEGVGTRLRQINDLAETLPAEERTPRAVLVTAPVRELEWEELLALREFRNDGGAVVLLGSAAASTEHTKHLNDLASRLRTDLRFNQDAVVDDERNLAGDPTVLETTAFDDSFPLFDAYEPNEDEQPERDDTECPGNSGTAPGHRGNSPGNSGNAPGHDGVCPGNAGTPPGHRGNGPGNS
ncbi:DUF4350 domain-containing protein [Halopiger djelfimassiliensis]|uniref:DUF4350 domain-containing protein n=1 Tax=Halopiger djelfimassiliensis TaxID=1293047 RepID=UPI0006778BD5|nr:DUF4350 domain-containing protein [Halopiger djelfimassiliensis]